MDYNEQARILLKEGALYKIARKTEAEQAQSNAGGLFLGGSAAFYGGRAIREHGLQSLGQVTVYHGTHRDSIPGIQREGLKPSLGGTGVATNMSSPTEAGSKILRDNARNRVYVSSYKDVARGVSAQNMHPEVQDALREKNLMGGMMSAKSRKAFLKYTNPISLKREKVVKAHVNYDKYHNQFEADPDAMGPLQQKIMGQAESKRVAARSMPGVGLDTSEISGGNFKSKLKRVVDYAPKFIKANPQKFVRHAGIAGLGVGGVGLGAALIGHGLHNMYSQHKQASDDMVDIDSPVPSVQTPIIVNDTGLNPKHTLALHAAAGTGLGLAAGVAAHRFAPNTFGPSAPALGAVGGLTIGSSKGLYRAATKLTRGVGDNASV